MSNYARLLVQKLGTEQRQRLRAEEQAASFAAAQDQRVHRLEARLKELEGGHVLTTRGAGGGGLAMSPRGPLHLLPHSPRSHDNVFFPHKDERLAAPLEKLEQQQEVRPAAAAAPPTIPPLPIIVKGGFRQQQRPLASGSAEDAVVHTVVVAGSAPASDGGRAPSGASSEGPVILSLEEQLQAVSSEFQQSVELWQRSLLPEDAALQGSRATVVVGSSSAADEEFLPDSPRSL
jgi:hypothetical protein